VVTSYREVRGKLGFFGKVWRVLFWGWQMLMVFWLFKYAYDVAPLIKANTSPAGHVDIGTGIGLTMAVGMIAFFCVAGSIILGLFGLFTRRTKMLVPLDDISTLHTR
jgi:hypothetical protein